MRSLARKLASLLILLAVPAAADVHPNTAPGFPVDQSFHVGDIDNVNLFNGSLTLTVPIGGSYPVNGGFSYSLKLVYNGNPWSFYTSTYMYPTGEESTRTFAVPNECSNAGLGWRVSFGQMDPPCQAAESTGPVPVYQDENGTDHIFYPTLHFGDPEDANPAGVTDVQYTRNGSYLRLKKYSAGYREIGFPDGTVRRFDNQGRPTEIRDPLGNKLSISYAVANRWILTDSQNRVHTIYFTTIGEFSVIDHIDLAAFGGTTATYQFQYTQQTVGRPCPHDDMGLGNSLFLPLLTSVSLPDGSSYQSDYLTAVSATTATCTDGGGNLLGLKLPTLGKLEWTWQKYQFPGGFTQKPRLQKNDGVATRTMRDVSGNVLGTWTYESAPNTAGSKEHTTTVTDPLSYKTVHYFSVATDLGYTGWSRYDYSLPFTRSQTLDAGGVTLNLSHKVYDSAGTLLRSEYVLYERDPADSSQPPQATHTNRRMLRSRTVYHDDTAGTWAGVIDSSFDGLGHYRQQQTEGNFLGSNARTHFGNYNPDRGTYVINQGANTGIGYTVLPASSPWVLETLTYASDTEGSATAQTDFCYAASTATVTRRLVHRLNGATASAQDLATVYDLDGNGNVTAEKSYGGDLQGGLGGGDLCSLALPVSPEFQVNHTYASGVRATSQSPGVGFYSLDQTIDPNTGLVSSSRDSAGLQTDFEYDALGRMTWSKPALGHGGWTQYLYTAASSSQTARVTLRRRDNGSKTAAIRATEFYIFDSFGRISQEQRQLPGGVSKRETTYDGAGNKATVSEAALNAPSNVTWFLSYDPFGRPGLIRPPDGAAHDVTLAYQGVRQVDRTVQIATAAGTETASTTTEIYDRHGRLYSVSEPSGSGGAAVTTTYGYDVGNRLTSVSMPSQSRSFSYDRAGLLQSETHPEKGASGNGTVSYPQYDSRGHARRKTDGPNDLLFTYGAAERLTQVQEAGSGGRVLKSFTYASANGTNDWAKGKLRQAQRYNYVTIGATLFTVRVDETYTYEGRDGRASQRDTAFYVAPAGSALALHESFTQGFAYNTLGLVSSLDYPLCTHGECTPAPPVFADVPATHPNQREIDALYEAGVTNGCATNPLSYCPGNNVTRAEMAKFLVLAATPGFTPPPCSVSSFADVNCATDWFAPWVEEIFRRGLTQGCALNPRRYCPSSLVTRAEISKFLLLAREGVSYLPTPSPCPTAFADVPCTHWAAGWITEASRRGVVPGCGGTNFCPDTAFTRAEMAGFLTRGFDLPVAIDPKTSRNVQLTYNQGLLTNVSANGVAYGSITYHPNLLVSQVTHTNGTVETQANDPNEMRRPSSLSAASLYASWSSGAYSYDGAGNVKSIGTATYTYDKVSRLTSAGFYDGPAGAGNYKQQSYTFDSYGNLTGITTNGTLRSTPTSTTTNRLTGAVSYDAAGNLTSWNGAAYQYDRFNLMTRMISGSEDWTYLYTADDERIWSYGANLSRWTLRDLDGKVLREYLSGATERGWSLGTDYLYRDGLLLAAETQTGRRHFHLDHLGTPRLITRASGDKASYHVYYPFGEEATAFNQDKERMKFTGHERDLASAAGAGDDLDYMHARHCSPVTGRFLSVDPALESAEPKKPQTWHRYSYVASNPLKYVDPTGEILYFFGSPNDLRQLQQIANAKLHGADLVIDQSGRASLVPNAETGAATPEQQAFASTLADAINRPQSVNMTVVNGDRGVIFGQYISGKIDIRDIAAAGTGRGVDSAALLAHEVAEQTAKQTMHLSNDATGFTRAHPFGVAAQQAASGYTRLSSTDTLNRQLTGNIIGTHQRGNNVVTVTFQFANGNLFRVTRRP